MKGFAFARPRPLAFTRFQALYAYIRKSARLIAPWRAVWMQSDKRTVGRKRLLMHATAVPQGTAVELGCVVRDVSETGAQLIGSHVKTLNGEFVLSTDHFVLPVRCRVVWRKRHSVGVEFVEVPTLRPIGGPAIRLF